jgi:hypothetical protein
MNGVPGIDGEDANERMECPVNDSGNGRPAGDAGVRILIGIVCLVFVTVIAWFSSIATMRLSRSAPGGVTCSIEMKALGLIPFSRVEIGDVLSASLVRSRAEGSRSHTPDRLVFVTDAGPVDAGYFQQLFTRDLPGIDAFLKSPSDRELTISSVARWKERGRFVLAQLATALLALCGVLLIKSGVTALLGSD